MSNIFWQVQNQIADSDISLIDRILIQRGYHEKTQRDEFLSFDPKKLCDPFSFPDMKKACELIESHHKSGGKIVVHGDYDADGVTATAVLIRQLRRLGIPSDFVIPARIEDGYGLTESSIEKLLEKRPTLVITVDCGIASIKEVQLLIDKGIDIIVTDHHECKDELPNASAIINPKVPGCGYSEKYLAGVGVAFKLVQALDRYYGNKQQYQFDLALVAVGTVADVVPLVGENRTLVKAGLHLLNNLREKIPAGLTALIEQALSGAAVTSTAIGFGFGPRINAAGRMGDATPALMLMLSEDSAETKELAILLDKRNNERKQVEQDIFDAAVIDVEGRQTFSDEPVTIVKGEGWHSGVIGIVCSKLVERYNKPAIVLAQEKDSLKGSCRSIGDFNILEALNSAAKDLSGFGGHQAAAGLHLSLNNYQSFFDSVQMYAEKHTPEGGFRKEILIDLILLHHDLTLDNAEELSKLEPFGEGNERPLFATPNLTVSSIRAVGKESKHVQLTLRTETKEIISCIGFSMPHLLDEIEVGDSVSAAFCLDINEYNGNKKVQLQIKDIRK